MIQSWPLPVVMVLHPRWTRVALQKFPLVQRDTLSRAEAQQLTYWRWCSNENRLFVCHQLCLLSTFHINPNVICFWKCHLSRAPGCVDSFYFSLWSTFEQPPSGGAANTSINTWRIVIPFFLIRCPAEARLDCLESPNQSAGTHQVVCERQIVFCEISPWRITACRRLKSLVLSNEDIGVRGVFLHNDAAAPEGAEGELQTSCFHRASRDKLFSQIAGGLVQGHCNMQTSFQHTGAKWMSGNDRFHRWP